MEGSRRVTGYEKESESTDNLGDEPSLTKDRAMESSIDNHFDDFIGEFILGRQLRPRRKKRNNRNNRSNRNMRTSRPTATPRATDRPTIEPIVGGRTPPPTFLPQCDDSGKPIDCFPNCPEQAPTIVKCDNLRKYSLCIENALRDGDERRKLREDEHRKNYDEEYDDEEYYSDNYNDEGYKKYFQDELDYGYQDNFENLERQFERGLLFSQLPGRMRRDVSSQIDHSVDTPFNLGSSILTLSMPKYICICFVFGAD